MTYVVRHTRNPAYDIERNWSGWMNPQADSYNECLAEVADMDSRYFELVERYGEGNTKEEILELFADRYEIDIRFHEKAHKWLHYHHDGLSCFTLAAENEQEALQEATENAAKFPWRGEGDCTLGTVRHVQQIAETLHLFECEDTEPEQY